MTYSIPAQFNTDATRDAYLEGRSFGQGFACNNVPRIGDRICKSVDYVGLGSRVTPDNIAEYHELLCFAAADNARSYSPFEFTAHEFNSSDDPDELWEAFEEGVADQISEELAGYTYEEEYA